MTMYLSHVAIVTIGLKLLFLYQYIHCYCLLFGSLHPIIIYSIRNGQKNVCIGKAENIASIKIQYAMVKRMHVMGNQKTLNL